ncbi:MAG: hypothetical protein MUC88_22105 [Planctomycetes bacterium]|nr:hypothetical protein [Planctomycetota bacterium]
MNVRKVFIAIGLIGLGVALGGCQSSLCPQGEELAKAGQPRQAVDAYLECRSAEKNAKRIAQINEQIKTLTPQIVEPVLAKWNNQPPDSVREYEQAIADLESVRRYDEPDTPWDIAQRVTKYQDELQKTQRQVQTWRDQAMDLKARHLWSEAVALLNKALALDPDSLGVQEQFRAALRDRNEEYGSRIAVFCQADQWKEANEALARFVKEMPKPQDDLIQELTRNVDQTKTRVTERVKSDMTQKAYYRAYTRLLTLAPESSDGLLRMIRREGPQYYLEQIEKSKSEGDNYGAYLAATKAVKLAGLDPDKPDRNDPDHRAIFDQYRDYDRRVDDAIRVEICLAAFESPATDTTSVPGFADRLATDLRQKLPYGLFLDDRRRVDYAQAELKLGMHDALQLMRVSWVIQGSISMHYVASRQERDRPVVVPIRRKVNNPSYNAAMDTLLDRYGKNEAKWPKDLIPSKIVEEELPQTISYKVGTERMEVQYEVVVNVYSDTEGVITASKNFGVPEELRTVSQNFCYSDDIKILMDTSTPIDADKIEKPERPQMPSELRFKEEREKAVRDQVVSWLLERDRFGHREKQFLTDAEKYRQDLQDRQAVEAAAKGYLYCLKAGAANVDAAAFARLEQLALIELTEESTTARPVAP